MAARGRAKRAPTHDAPRIGHPVGAGPRPARRTIAGNKRAGLGPAPTKMAVRMRPDGPIPPIRGKCRTATKGVGIIGPCKTRRRRAPCPHGAVRHLTDKPQFMKPNRKNRACSFSEQARLIYKYSFRPGSGPPPDERRRTAPAAWAFRSCRWGCGGHRQR